MKSVPGLYYRLRLRHKLAALLSVAALLPVGVVSWLAGSVVLGNLDRSLSEDTDRQLQVGLSLVLRHVEHIGADAVRLARGGELSAAMDARARDAAVADTASLSGVLDRVSAYLTPSLVQVFDQDGAPVARATVHNVGDDWSRLRVAPRSDLVVAALDYDSPLTIEPVARTLVVRAAAPIVDSSYRLLGAVVVSAPLDGPFSDEIKSALGTDVLIFAAERTTRPGQSTGPGADPAGDPAVTVHHATSTFVDDTGNRYTDIFLPPAIAARAHHQGSVLESRGFFGRQYQVGYTGLLDFDGRQVGVFAVAVDRASLARAKRVATRSLLVVALGALVVALFLAGFLTRRLTRPLARLHRGALAVARGDLDQRIELDERDEIGDLATAFSRMTEALEKHQERLAASAEDNARLYDEVRALNEALEAKVEARTAALTRANDELGRTITELRETQAQLILSERMAGLGLLVAGVAHEINSPTAAIAGSVDGLADTLVRLRTYSRDLVELGLDPGARDRFIEKVSDQARALGSAPMRSAVAIRRAARGFRQTLEADGLALEQARPIARRLAEVGADDELASWLARVVTGLPVQQRDQGAELLASYLSSAVFVHRSAYTIRRAIDRIQTIVRALKTYSHLDQEAGRVPIDLHEGIENTLVILDYELRDITITRKYGELPDVPVFVDELNQVWTNLVHNAVQAMQGEGEIIVETGVAGRGDRGSGGTGTDDAGTDDAAGRRRGVVVRIIDDGPGIPPDVIPRIFEPFFTTKGKGEGTGLGLGIVQQIIDKHHGHVDCESRPGRTCFEVWLPLDPVSSPDETPDDVSR